MDAANLTLLKVAEADLRESTLLDAEHSAIRAGNSTAGGGPTAKQWDARQHERELKVSPAKNCLGKTECTSMKVHRAV